MNAGIKMITSSWWKPVVMEKTGEKIFFTSKDAVERSTK